MSKDNCSSRPIQLLANENEFENPLNQIPLIPSRTPLNLIPDPSQCQSTTPQHDTKDKPPSSPHLISSLLKMPSSRAYDRGKSYNIEPYSAQSTPVRSARRLSNVGTGSGGYTSLVRLPGGGKFGLLPRVSRGISVAIPAKVSADVPRFELDEDPSFWNDHNVQVLIRIRPLNDVEMVSQGSGRCLRQESAQTVVWLGHPETRFTFDHIACESTSQEKLFKVVGLPMVDNCMSGYNSCMFTYGQTGSGKTYTMMGEIDKMDGKLSDDCGITPRIYEYLFTRITKEEESRKHERLTYSCKCSFLEIYNEHITDLLEPSSTNLQLREDLKKGVYVENLTEHSVRTVNDILKLLQQGAANRKIASTYMNSESSRSHSVFTCIIESRWEKDSMAHLRFGRLNLVDLAGSERQKSSGEEGDRLKEAANINKSLSTLGLVIMSLVDLAQGKQRHVPYRDSRLTFLLQDSLGGNSKTAIIANVSPSISSANETLSTLKFAQRAKLIQNNAKINEDASGDVIVLQQQIQQLKGQLSFLMKHHHDSTKVQDFTPSPDQSSFGYFIRRHESFEESNVYDEHEAPNEEFVKIKYFKATLTCAMRREKLAEMEVRRLKSEIELLNHLAHQREDESQHSKMMLRFREEKIKRLELLSEQLISADKFYLDENKALREENLLLQTKIDRNPEVMASENIRLLEQIRSYRNFYEQGETQTLVAEMSELRNQFLELLEVEKSDAGPRFFPMKGKQELEVSKALERCKYINSTLIREVDELMHQNANGMNWDNFTLNSRSDSVDEATSKHLQRGDAIYDKNDLQMEHILQFDNVHKQLMDAQSSIATMKVEHVQLVKELQSLQTENQRLLKNVGSKRISQSEVGNIHEDYDDQIDSGNQYASVNIQVNECTGMDKLQAKLDNLSCDLKGAEILNRQHTDDHTRRLSQDDKAELIRNEAELETAQTIIYLQEEIDRLQSEFQVHLCSLTEQNTSLRNNLAVKEDELRMFCAEWERAIMELTTFLIDGCRSLGDASCQIKSISSSFPNVNDWIGEHVEKAAKICLEKEETILLLQNSLEDAKKAVMQMQQKLFSLMGATIVLTEVQQMKISTCGEEFQFPKVSYDTHEVKEYAETRFISEKAQITENQDAAALLVEHRTPDCSMSTTSGNVEQSMLPAHRNAHGTTDVDGCIKLEISILSEIEDAVNRLCSNATALDSDIHCAVSVYRELVHNLLKDISDMRKDIAELKKNQGSLKLQIPQQIRNELVEINKRLTYMHACFYNIRSVHCHLDSTEGSTETERWTTDFYSCSNSSVETLVNDEKSSSVINGCICKLTDGKEDLNCVEGSSMSCNIVFLHLMEEFRKAYGSFLKLRYHLMEFSVGETNQSRVDHIFSDICPLKRLKEQGPDRHDHPADQRIAGNNNLGELVVEEKCYPPTSFFDKFEESYATIKEADDVLKVMLKANETVNMLTAMWKHEGEELMADKASLGEQIKHLKSCILTGHEEKAVLQDEVQLSSKEIVILLTLLEGCFLKMQTGLEEVFDTANGNAVEDVKSLFCSLRSFLEDLMCKSIENDFSIFVLQCQMVEYFEKQRWEKSISTHAISTHHEDCLITGAPEQRHEGRNDNSAFPAVTRETDGDQFEYISTMKVEEMDLVLDESNSELVNQLKRKDILMKGLLFDFSLLQEFASHRKDIKDELEKLLVALSKVQHELQIKTVHLDDVLDHNMKLEGCLSEAEQALFNSNYELDQIKGKLNILSEHNVGLKDFLKDLYLKNSKAEQLLEEQKEAIKNLEREIVRVSSSEKQKNRAVEDIEDTLIRVTAERDELVKTLTSLQDKFDLACALADENQAIAAEARQESEASKIFVEQKEEEVKILEHSIEELECTINVLEKKVSEMEDEVAKHRLMSDSLELELKELRHRLSTVEDFTESLTSENSNAEVTEDQLLRKLHGKCGEINEPRDQIRILQEENAKQSKEINQFKDYISELVLHAEAQASQYQQKYKNLEAMLNEVKTDLSSVSAQSTSERAEKISTRARGSSSPFKCIAGLIQQMNQEKDQELSISRHRIKELEALAASRHQEVCVLNTRMASAESMTHDVIRDLLSVKLDISNYTNIIDQHQLQRLIEDAQHQRQEFVAMEREIFNLRSRIADLLEERERCIFEINKNKEQQLATQITVEQLRERNQLLVAQNDMLKMDKSNLQKRIVELDAMVKKLLKMQDMQPRNQLQTSSSLRSLDSDFGERLVDSQKMLSRINNQLAQYHQPGADTLNMRANGTKSRK